MTLLQPPQLGWADRN